MAREENERRAGGCDALTHVIPENSGQGFGAGSNDQNVRTRLGLSNAAIPMPASNNPPN